MPLISVFFEQTMYVYSIMASLILIIVLVPPSQISTSKDGFRGQCPIPICTSEGTNNHQLVSGVFAFVVFSKDT